MKKLIRKSAFETNSSSSHAITISSDCDFVMDSSLISDDNGVLNIKGYGFGWQYQRTNDAGLKAAYLYLSYRASHRHLVTEVIKETTGASKILFNNIDVETSNDGILEECIFVDHGNSIEDPNDPEYRISMANYIDHDSAELWFDNVDGIQQKYGLGDDFHKKCIKLFVFSKNSWLFLGNDNDSIEPEFYAVPKIDNAGIPQEPFKNCLFTIPELGIEHRFTIPDNSPDFAVRKSNVVEFDYWDSNDIDKIIRRIMWDYAVSIDKKGKATAIKCKPHAYDINPNEPQRWSRVGRHEDGDPFELRFIPYGTYDCNVDADKRQFEMTTLHSMKNREWLDAKDPKYRIEIAKRKLSKGLKKILKSNNLVKTFTYTIEHIYDPSCED